MKFECRLCGVAFAPKRSDAAYCSKRCKRRAHWMRRGEEVRKRLLERAVARRSKLICLHCRRPILQAIRIDQKYCDRRCREKARIRPNRRLSSRESWNRRKAGVNASRRERWKSDDGYRSAQQIARRNWLAKVPGYHKQYCREWRRRLADGYIRARLNAVGATRLPASMIPHSLIEVKRAHLLIARTLRKDDG